MRLIIKDYPIVGTDFNATPYVKYQGAGWQRNDVNGENSGRTLAGTMIVDRKGTKIRLDCECPPLPEDIARNVLNAIYPEYLTISYDDPQLGFRQNIRFYSNNVPATYCMRRNGVDWWMGIKFPLIEV